jgi:hypothetical protein
VLFDNSWQFFISCTYLLYNGLLSTFLVADELVGFAKTRKPLRGSAPVGVQRSSSFVSMPAKYGIPLMTTIGFLYWTVSQSLFVIYIDRYYSNGVEATTQRYVTSGFSCVAILTCKYFHSSYFTSKLMFLLAIIIGGFLLLALVALGMRRYSGEVPLASTCSAAISALCHAPEEDTEVALFPVMWGDVSHDEIDVGHCSFTTAADVKEPIVGRLYI